jgi:hypothetical protein
MKRTLLLSLLAAFTFAGTILASAEDTRFVSFGAGVRSCGTWTETRRSGNTTTTEYYQQWVAGFLSATNMFTARNNKIGNIDILAQPNIDTQGLWAWVDNYCIANPLDTVTDAADALGADLVGRAWATKKAK